MPARIGLLSTIARALLALYVGLAVLLLTADVWFFVRHLWPPGRSAYEIDANPPPRTCAYEMTDQQRQPAGLHYAQIWKVVCSYDQSKAYRPDDYPGYFYALLTKAPARSAASTYLPVGALVARALSKMSATWQGDELHVATWSGGLMDKAGQIDGVAIAFDLRGDPARGRP